MKTKAFLQIVTIFISASMLMSYVIYAQLRQGRQVAQVQAGPANSPTKPASTVFAPGSKSAPVIMPAEIQWSISSTTGPVKYLPSMTKPKQVWAAPQTAPSKPASQTRPGTPRQARDTAPRSSDTGTPAKPRL